MSWKKKSMNRKCNDRNEYAFNGKLKKDAAVFLLAYNSTWAILSEIKTILVLLRDFSIVKEKKHK